MFYRYIYCFENKIYLEVNNMTERTLLSSPRPPTHQLMILISIVVLLLFIMIMTIIITIIIIITTIIVTMIIIMIINSIIMTVLLPCRCDRSYGRRHGSHP